MVLLSDSVIADPTLGSIWFQGIRWKRWLWTLVGGSLSLFPTWSVPGRGATRRFAHECPRALEKNWKESSQWPLAGSWEADPNRSVSLWWWRETTRKRSHPASGTGDWGATRWRSDVAESLCWSWRWVLWMVGQHHLSYQSGAASFLPTPSASLLWHHGLPWSYTCGCISHPSGTELWVSELAEGSEERRGWEADWLQQHCGSWWWGRWLWGSWRWQPPAGATRGRADGRWRHRWACCSLRQPGWSGTRRRQTSGQGRH